MHCIMRAWHVPDIFFRIYVQKYQAVLQFDLPDADSKRGVIIRSEAHWPWDYCLSISYHKTSRTTYAICIGPDASEASKIFAYLRSHIDLTDHFSIIPAVFSDFACHYGNRFNRDHDSDINEAQRLAENDIYLETDGHSSDSQNSFSNMDALEQKLASLALSTPALSSFLATHARIVAFLLDILNKDIESEHSLNKAGGD